MRVYIKKLLTYWEVKKQQKEEIDLFLKTYNLKLVKVKETSIILSCIQPVASGKKGKYNLVREKDGFIIDRDLTPSEFAKKVKEYRNAATKRKIPFEQYLDEISEGVRGSSARFAKKISKSLDNAPAEIHRVEKIYKKLDVEWGKVYNKNTRVNEQHTSNLPDAILWPSRIMEKARQAILTHNHPSGFGLSISDIIVLLDNRLNEIRAVAPNGDVFSLKITDKMKPKEIKDLSTKIKEIEIRAKLGGGISVENTATVNHRAFDDIFKLLGDRVTYTHFIN